MRIDKSNALGILRQCTTGFLYPIKMGGGVDVDKYNVLINALDNITRAFKNDELIPKSLLNEIYLTSLGLDAEVDFIKTHDLRFFSKSIMERYFMILAGKSVDDQKPTKGRVI